MNDLGPSTQRLESETERDALRQIRQQVSTLELSRPSGPHALARGLAIAALFTPTAVLALTHGSPGAWLLHIAVATVLLCTIPAVYHEGSHGNLARSRIVNDTAATLAAALHVVPFETWRLFHLTHHAQAGTDDDSEVYPLSWSRLTLITFPLQYWLFVALLWRWTVYAGTDKGPTWIRLASQVRAVRRSGAASVVVLTVLGVLTVAFPPLALLLVAPLCLSVMLAACTLVPEHHPAHRIGPGDAGQLDRTASFQPAAPVRFLMWNSNLHAAHHLAPGVPAHQLPRVDEAIASLQAPEWRHRGYLRWYRATLRGLPWRASHQ